MSPPVFVDTSAWYAAVAPNDSQHEAAARRFTRLQRERRTLLTTNHVVSESYTMMRMRLGDRDAHQVLRLIRSSAQVRKVFVPESWEDAAEDLLVRHADQPFSYVDATSFVTIRRLRLQEALAFDHHFLVAGFALVGDT